MSDNELERTVIDELNWDPKLDGRAIAVSVNNGVVTLRGTVGSLRQKWEAREDAKRVYGVKSVDNELQVRILDDQRRDDAELRGVVLQALSLNDVVPAGIDAKVDDGLVRLTGKANWKFQRDEAGHVAASVRGVVHVINEIELVAPGPSVHDLEHSIKKAMERNARLDAEEVSVESLNGTVTLRGTVSSWADHDQAVEAAWSAPGVTRVKDHLLVMY
jgi:osmotically-inducible protein OsmY